MKYLGVFVLHFMAQFCYLYAQQIDYKNPIEFTQNGQKILIYQDIENSSKFWYDAPSLTIQRLSSGNTSRLNFSLELQEERSSSGTKEYCILNMVVDPNLPAPQEEEMKEKLCELGYAQVHPFDPINPYSRVQLLPLFTQGKVEFDVSNLFINASWLNQQVFDTIDFSHPFPIQIRMDRDDANILVGSWLKSRNTRVGKIRFGRNRYKVIDLSLDFPLNSMPLAWKIGKQMSDQWEIIFSNPTEHDVELSSFEYLTNTPDRGWQWKQKFLMGSILKSYEDEHQIQVRSLRVNLLDQPYRIRNVQWVARYDYPKALALYLKNDLPGKGTECRIGFSGNTQIMDRAGIHEDSLMIDFQFVDEFGLRHYRKLPLHLDSLAISNFYLLTFGRLKALNYRMNRTIYNTLFSSNWVSYRDEFLGQLILLNVENLYRLPFTAIMNEQQHIIYDHANAFVIEESRSNQQVLIAKWAKNESEGLSRSITYIPSIRKLEIDLQLTFPVSLEDQQQIVKALGVECQLPKARLKGAHVSIWVEGQQLISHQWIPSSQGDLNIYVQTDWMTEFPEAPKLMLKVQAVWEINHEDWFTTYWVHD